MSGYTSNNANTVTVAMMLLTAAFVSGDISNDADVMMLLTILRCQCGCARYDREVMPIIYTGHK